MPSYPMRSPEEWVEEILKPENVADDHGIVCIVRAIIRETYDDAAQISSRLGNVIRQRGKEVLEGEKSKGRIRLI